MKVLRQNKDRRPSMRSKVCLSLGSLAAILLLSGVLAILEYRRMSDYVSELIAANINRMMKLRIERTVALISEIVI